MFSQGLILRVANMHVKQCWKELIIATSSSFYASGNYVQAHLKSSLA